MVEDYQFPLPLYLFIYFFLETTSKQEGTEELKQKFHFHEYKIDLEYVRGTNSRVINTNGNPLETTRKEEEQEHREGQR